MSLAEVLDRIFSLPDEPIFLVKNLYYYLLPLLQQLASHQLKVLVVVTSESAKTALQSELVSFLDDLTIILSDQLATASIIGYYPYMICTDRYLPVNWSNYANQLIVPLENFPEKSGIIILTKLPFSTTFQYNQDFYQLADVGDLYLSMARQAAFLSYVNPTLRILLLLPSKVEIESLQQNLNQSQVPTSIYTLENRLDGPGIILADRSIALLLASVLSPDYTLDSLVEKRWEMTWTQGRRCRHQYLPKNLVDQTVMLGGVVKLMTPREFYQALPLTSKELTSRWQLWPHQSIEERFRDFLLATNLGFYPGKLMWRWYQDGKPLFPMISLVALIDSYGPPFFEYPLASPNLDEQDYRLIRRHHQEKYFQPFLGENDLATLLQIWLSFLDYSGGFESAPEYFQDWSSIHSIRADKIIEVYSQVERLIEFFQDHNETVATGPFDLDDFLQLAEPILEEVYSSRLLTQSADRRDVYYSKINTYVRVSIDYQLSNQPPPPQLYGIVVKEEKVGQVSRCLLWITYPKKTPAVPQDIINIMEGYPEK